MPSELPTRRRGPMLTVGFPRSFHPSMNETPVHPSPMMTRASRRPPARPSWQHEGECSSRMPDEFPPDGEQPATTWPVRLRTVKGGGGLSLCVAEAGNPEGPPLLFIHGFSQSHLAWRRQLVGPLGAGFRLVALDLRGHGHSEKPEGVYTEGRAWAEDIHAVITALQLERPVLVGWSYGGLVLTDYLRHYGQRHVAGVHFVGALPRAGTPEALELYGPDLRELLPGLFSHDADSSMATLQAFVSLLFHRPVPPEQLYAVLGYTSAVPTYVREGIGARVVDAEEVLRGLSLPVLVSHGLEDRVVRLEAGRYIASVVPQAELSLYTGVGHSPFWEDAPRFNRELMRFVARCW
jgi:non-heme chloroperoxidase